MDFEAIRIRRNETNPYGKRMGMWIEEIREGYARVVKEVTQEDLNSVGVPHGGVYFSMADTASAAAMASRSCHCVTIGTTYNFLRSAKPGDRLTAEARESKAGRTICFYEVEVRDQDGRLLGTCSTSFFRLDSREAPAGT